MVEEEKLTKAQTHQIVVGENYYLKRFLEKIKIRNSCWEWTASKNENGYGYFRIDNVLRRSHRVIFEYFYGALDHNLEINHLCKNRKCVNPIHLEQITHKENTLKSNSPSALNSKKTCCKKGHKFTLENTNLYKNRRCCRQCNIIRCINWRKKNG